VTPNDLILQALKAAGVIGVGQVASAEDMNDCLFQLNLMLGQWSRKRWLVYHLVDASVNSTGAQSYSVGTGGDFNIARPDKIEFAFFRQIVPSQPSLIDYPLTIYYSRQDYDRIALKTLNSWPQVAFYDAAYPLGSLYVWPVPSSAYSIHITVKETLTQFTSLNQTINLPPEYQGALFWNLSRNIRPLYQLPPDPTVIQNAKAALGTLRQANIQVPRALLPSEITRNGPAYNIYSDT
jgi:hypothetical protein